MDKRMQVIQNVTVILRNGVVFNNSNEYIQCMPLYKLLSSIRQKMSNREITNAHTQVPILVAILCFVLSSIVNV